MKTEQRVIVVFPTPTDALHLEYVCRAEGVPGRMIPVPGSIKAGCGLAFSAPPETEQRLRTLAEANSIRVDGFYRRVL